MAIVDTLLEKGILVSPDVTEDPELLEKLESLDVSAFEGVDLIGRDFFSKDALPKSSHFEILFSYSKKPKKISLTDFVSYFNRRLEALSSFLRQRTELQNVMSLARLKAKKDKDRASAIGLVYEKSVTKKNNVMITLEDPTGTIKVLVRQDKQELYAQAKEVMLDEVIGVEGTISNGYLFANQIFVPDIPSTKELKKGPEEEYVLFVGDPHFGSKFFLKDSFADFIAWVNQKRGNAAQRRIASKVKYIIFTGDLVEGVGIYPGQEEDLEINDVKAQYDLFSNYLKSIPTDITLFIIPGNHDAGRLSEPQQPILHNYAESLRSLPNVVLLSNPAIVRLGIKENFPGFDMLIYHGYSMIYYANNVESIRSAGGQKRPDLIMKFLLQRRHLAPSHTSNLYIPDSEEDPLVIKHIPDFFVTGHIHRASVGQYKNITLLNCSCWDGVTEDQEKRGLEPQPARLPIVNLKTREVKIINFMRGNAPEVSETTPEPEDAGQEK
ncbi:metallophosphoesterase [Candidatus Woesearchaeota archaeon]|nr:metallophosphoesterase [Candidatus Woesearchaeota archaeon]